MGIIPVDGDLDVLGELTRQSAGVMLRHPIFEGIPQFGYGHSMMASDGGATPRARPIDLITPRLGLGRVINRAKGGVNSVGITGFVHGGTYEAWTPGHKGVVWLHAGANDMIQADMTIAANLAQLTREVESALVYLCSGTFIHALAATATGSWTTQAGVDFAVGGNYRFSSADNATDKLSFALGGATPKWALHYFVPDGVALHGRDFTILEDGNVLATINPEVFPTATQWPGNNGAGHAVYMASTSATTVESRNTTTESGGSGTPALHSINGVSIPSATPPLVMVLADMRPIDYATAGERSGVFTAISDAVNNVNTWLGRTTPNIYLVDLGDGFPTDYSMLGTDNLHLNDAGSRFVADKMTDALLQVTEQPWAENDVGTDLVDRPQPLVANKVTSGASEQIVHIFKVPAFSTVVGDSYRIKLRGYSQGTGTLICRARIGALGTIADPVAFLSTTTGAQAANQHFSQEIEVTVRANGTSGSVMVDGDGQAHQTSWPGSGTPAATTVNVQNFWYMVLTLTVSTSTATVTHCVLEKLDGRQRIDA